MKSSDDLVTVFTTNKAPEAELVKNLLEEEGIRCEVANEMQAGFSGVLEIPVLVLPEDEQRARELIASHERLKEDEPVEGE